jgi:uncharacterized protein (DUF488 family)
MSNITLYTIGFTRKSAEKFFTTLENAKVRLLIDVRLNNVSQLAGFAKRADLQYFLSSLCAIDYVHRPDLAPDEALLKSYRDKTIDWTGYQQQFITLLHQRAVENSIDRGILAGGCLLCSEAEATKCHRRLVAEYLREKLGNITLCHL